MKKQITLLVLAISCLTISCSSEDDGFDDANQDAAKKYVKRIITTGEGESNVSEINYDSQGRVTSATSDNQSRFFSYNDEGDGGLKKVSGDGDNIITNEIISEIQEAYEIGDVLQYDERGNPTVLELYDEDYDGNQITNIATIAYDDKPFTFYYTLDAAGIIDVLYDVRLQFYAPEEIVMAKKLLPVNNPVRAVIKNESNQEISTISVNYNYDSEGYPETTSVISIDDEGYAESYSVVYEYR